jgi:hypothetical protein
MSARTRYRPWFGARRAQDWRSPPPPTVIYGLCEMSACGRDGMAAMGLVYTGEATEDDKRAWLDQNAKNLIRQVAGSASS